MSKVYSERCPCYIKTNIRKIGNSEGLIVPAIILRSIQLYEGDQFEIKEEDNKIVIVPVRAKPKYSLKQLLAECDESAPMPNELTDWNCDAPVGNELI